MEVETFIKQLNCDFYTGVPDSLLKPLCSYLLEKYGTSGQHIIASNEGNATALAAGYHMATGRTAVVYLQNSGLGNILNPAVSLLNPRVYGIPCIFLVGFRGEPGQPDEPQHIYQGEITIKLLEDMDMSVTVIDNRTTEEEFAAKLREYSLLLSKGKSVAFVVKNGALHYKSEIQVSNPYRMTREEAIEEIVQTAGQDLVVSTTGKASRELYEIREKRVQSHDHDFLTVGSMGHSSSIAMGIALNKPDIRVWCIDGDGAALMHMGAMAVIGTNKPSNLIHIVINNGAHESVGGMPTAAFQANLWQIADGCGYPNVVLVDTKEALKEALLKARDAKVLSFLEVRCSVGSRQTLGRPGIPAIENKENFMKRIGKI